MLKIGINNTPRVAEDGEQLKVKVVDISQKTQTNGFNEVQWRAYILKFKPLNTEKHIKGFEVRMYLDDPNDPTFETLGEPFIEFLNRFNQFANQAYGIDEFDLEDLIGAKVTVIHKRTKTQKSIVEIVQVHDIPKLNVQANEPDASLRPEREMAINETNEHETDEVNLGFLE